MMAFWVEKISKGTYPKGRRGWKARWWQDMVGDGDTMVVVSIGEWKEEKKLMT